jgi:hypothetical protein
LRIFDAIMGDENDGTYRLYSDAELHTAASDLRAALAAGVEAEPGRAALEYIAETAGWYARNGQRLALEVDHALCVEVLDAAERGLGTYPAGVPGQTTE